ncbi:hypothetical protein [Kutzneria kofuensis]|uniref:DUF5648 domain-containing protein n=1 Tax=Kutzneria kofuensis TaxID=103725 RepID=A0A7W9NMR0_9PSEU|nr:hypothetical protein [Kutzneria kofuensis]MBB5897623.1 hypothetical protein [Kutzneria kofuensis]
MIVATVAALLLGTSTVSAHAAGQAAPAQHGQHAVPTPPAGTVAFYRLWNPTTEHHLYTTSWAEVLRSIQDLGFKYEGSVGYVYPTKVPGTVELYRLRSGADHLYTASWEEMIEAIQHDGYKYEGVAAYVYPTKAAGTIELYRLWHPIAQDHFYTQVWSEVIESIQNNGYKYEGVAAYIFPA